MTLEFYDDDLRLADGAALPPDTVVQPGSHRALVVGIAQARRRLGNLLFLRAGCAVAAELGVAVKRVATNQTFFWAQGRGQRTVAIGARDVLLLRSELGAVVSQGGNASIPVSLLFRAGGTRLVCGHGYRSIGNDVNATGLSGAVFGDRQLGISTQVQSAVGCGAVL